MKLYKVTTHDLRPPVRGGDPIWDGSLPYDLPVVEVDRSDKGCSAGWNACERPETALRIAGLWPNGRPSRLWILEAEDVVVRGDKVRFATGRIVEEVTDLTPSIRALSEPFGYLRDDMLIEQLAWRYALGRPRRDSQRVEAELQRALDMRGLKWSLRRFDAARDAWAAWAAWDARAARDAWAARAARDAWAAWAARDARAARDVWDARAARGARGAWAAGDAWAARAARDALTVHYAALRGWVMFPSRLLTAGLRYAYEHGLASAVPTGPNELGWAMVEGE